MRGKIASIESLDGEHLLVVSIPKADIASFLKEDTAKKWREMYGRNLALLKKGRLDWREKYKLDEKIKASKEFRKYLSEQLKSIHLGEVELVYLE